VRCTAIIPIDILGVSCLPDGGPVTVLRAVTVAVVVAIIVGHKRPVVGGAIGVIALDVGEIV